MDPLIILIHIPKTAGTSIRVAAELYFTPSRVLYDYGPDARQTSCLVREFIYQRQDYTGFAEAVEEQGFRFFCGHFPLSRYREVFPNARFCSWLREPAERLWSAWRYAVKQDGYAGSFADFYEKPGRRDRMCKMLGQDASEMDFVGSTENFTHSLERFNQLFKVNFRQYRANENEAAAGGRISEEDARRVRALNEKDCALYRSVIDSLKRQWTDVVLETPKQTLFQRLSTHTRSALARFGGRGAAEMKPSFPGKNVELDKEIERLHMSCRRLIWLNPLLRYDRYEPKSLGARAMLPHTDEFRSIHNLESLEQLAEALTRPDGHGTYRNNAWQEAAQ